MTREDLLSTALNLACDRLADDGNAIKCPYSEELTAPMWTECGKDCDRDQADCWKEYFMREAQTKMPSVFDPKELFNTITEITAEYAENMKVRG